MELCCCFCVLVFFALLFGTGPVFMNILDLMAVLPYHLGWWLALIIMGLLIFACGHAHQQCTNLFCAKPLPGDEAEEDEIDA